MKKQLEEIAFIKNGYNEKFGVPRQSGLAPNVLSEIHFQDNFSDENMLRDIEQYSHLWLIWGFSQNEGDWSPTVRPPRLGGNKRVGVFATRSPFRPNNLGLTVVELKGVKSSSNGKILVVSGSDLKNDTPIYDIKPYIPYVDSIPAAKGGFSEKTKDYKLQVYFNSQIKIDDDFKNELTEILSLDPRPSYQDDENRIYGLSYKNSEIKFTSDGKVIFVKSIEDKNDLC